MLMDMLIAFATLFRGARTEDIRADLARAQAER